MAQGDQATTDEAKANQLDPVYSTNEDDELGGEKDEEEISHASREILDFTDQAESTEGFLKNKDMVATLLLSAYIRSQNMDFTLKTRRRPFVGRQSSKVSLCLHKTRLSDKTLKLLARTNYRDPFYLTEPKYPDYWGTLSVLNRSAECLVTLLHVALLRQDIGTAWEAYCTMVHCLTDIEMADFWSIGLELLEKDQEAISRRGNKPMNEQVLEYLIVRFPALNASSLVASRAGYARARAPQFYPRLVKARMNREKLLETKSMLDELLSAMPYSINTELLSISGILDLCLGVQDPEYKKEAEKRFAQCHQCGGFVPEDIKKLCS